MNTRTRNNWPNEEWVSAKNNEMQQYKAYSQRKKEREREKRRKEKKNNSQRLELIMANGKLCKHNIRHSTTFVWAIYFFSMFPLLVLLLLLFSFAPSSASIHQFPLRYAKYFISMLSYKNEIPLRMKYVYLQYERHSDKKHHVQYTTLSINENKQKKKQQQQQGITLAKYLCSCMR